MHLSYAWHVPPSSLMDEPAATIATMIELLDQIREAERRQQ